MAGSASAIRAGAAFVELFADDSRLVRGLRSAEKRLQSWGKKVRDIGAKIFTVGGGLTSALFGVTKFAEGIGSALNDMSAKTGATVEALSALGFAAEQNGTSLEAVGNGLKFLQKNMVAAMHGSKEARDMFASLGINLQKLQGLSPDEQFLAIADAISKIQNPAKRTAAAMAVFGKSGADLLPLLNQGATGIRGFMAEAARLGIVISSQDAQALDDFGDALASLWGTLKGTAVVIGATLAPTFTRIAKYIQTAVKGVQDWINANRGIVNAVAIGAAVVTGLGIAIFGVGVAFTVASAAAGVFATIFGALGSVISALLSPIALVSAALLGIGFYVAQSAGFVSQAMTFLSGAFTTISGDAIAAFQAIRDALASGDIAAAAQVLWTLLKLEWARGVAALNSAWIPAKNFFLDIWSAAVTTVSGFFINAFYGIQIAWVHAIDFMRDGFDTFVSAIKYVFTGMVGGIATDLLRLTRASDEAIQASIEDTDRKTKEIKNAHRQRVSQREEERKAKIDTIDQRRRDALDANRQIFDRGKDQRDAGDEARIQAAQDAVDAAKKEFEKAVSSAKKPEGAAGTAAGQNLPAFDPKAFSREKTAVSGTFSSFALGQLGTGGGAAEETAKNTKSMDRTLKEYLKRQEANFDKGVGGLQLT